MVDKMKEIIYDLEQNPTIQIPENLIFGRTFTTHCFEMDYDKEKGGWYNPTIKKLENLSISPAAMVFHYGQAVFEGLKAYKHDDGKIVLFRPDKNFERLNNSSRKMCIPEIDIELAQKALIELVRIDKEWIPTKPGYSLYVRPFIISVDPFLGVRPADNYKFIMLLSPVGPYYPEGFKPVPILVTDKYVRAVRKGIGDCKTPANYAASLAAQAAAKKEGYSQVLWLDGIEQKYVEEVGTMNFFVRFKDEVTTPELTGSILPGITRMSVLQILKDWGYNVTERRISVKEIADAYGKDSDLELFGTGTAAVISSIGRLKYNDQVLEFGDEKAGNLATKLYEELTGIQTGKVEDRHNWLVEVE